MNCEKAKELYAEALAGPEPAALQAHLAGCAVCRDEFSKLQGIWESLKMLAEPEPGPEVRARFYQMLDAYEQGRTERPVSRPWWRLQPVWQLGLGAALLLIGIAIGQWVPPRKANTGAGGVEISQLRGEVNTMRQLVTLSLLQQQSASDRLRGVTWSYRVEQNDTEVLSALLHTINSDPSVNVRLAAVDAMHQFSASPVARKGLTQSLNKQTSPLVQIGILDMLVELREQPASPAIQLLAKQQALDPNVQRRIESALQQLK